MITCLRNSNLAYALILATTLIHHAIALAAEQQCIPLDSDNLLQLKKEIVMDADSMLNVGFSLQQLCM